MNPQNAKRPISLNHPLIDSQHNQLFDWLEKLEKALDQGYGSKEIEKILDNLCLYVEIHFTTEEELMRDIHYQKILKHRFEHNEFSNEIDQLKCDYEMGKPVLSVEIINILSKWLIEHINKSDADLRDYISDSR